MRVIKRVVRVLLPLALIVSLVGCNTMSGLGKDISDGGKELTHAADKSDK